MNGTDNSRFRYTSHLIRKQEHINTQETCVVEQEVLYWGLRWEGKRVMVHTDNKSVAYGLTHGTTHGALMEVLQWCLLLATEHDLCNRLSGRWWKSVG